MERGILRGKSIEKEALERKEARPPCGQVEVENSREIQAREIHGKSREKISRKVRCETDRETGGEIHRQINGATREEVARRQFESKESGGDEAPGQGGRFCREGIDQDCGRCAGIEQATRESTALDSRKNAGFELREDGDQACAKWRRTGAGEARKETREVDEKEQGC